ncbi:GntR family transcriptional regulator [Amycolatopsis orientalis]|uniref:GntR family transcriptional regulator n=1 Tax=Amycolatopsis orientalis TaxID=31958 RepID=UPI001EEE6237|nr:GntR family transcriptional regulator [Amycolatopsis orientalis]
MQQRKGTAPRTWSGEIADGIRRRIGDGELKPGDRVPSIRKIAEEWQVAHATATKAVAILRTEGLVETIPGAYTVVAGGPGSGRRRDNSRERIVVTALEIADEEGLDAVSMRAVATRLGGATMSLYNHVKGRSELVTLMAKTVLAGIAPVDEGLRGRSRLESSARSLWAAYRRYPWLTRFDVSGLGPLSWLAEQGEEVTEPVKQEEGSSTALHHRVLLHALVRGLAADLFGDGAGPDGAWYLTCLGQTWVNDADVLFDLGLRGLLDGLADGGPHGG